MRRDEALALLRKELPRLRSLYGVTSVRLVGSTARDTAETSSDIDLLVDFEETPSLFTLGKIKEDLEGKTGVRVDVMMESGLRPRTRRRVLGDAVPV